MFPDGFDVGTIVEESVCKYNVTEFKLNDEEKDTKESALIVFYWLTYKTKFEAVKGLYDAAPPGSYDE